jgi:predicted small secreted protein
MKKALFTALFASFCLIVSTTMTSCKTKEGCGLEEEYAAPTGKDGRISTKKGKSNLFSKKQRKKMKKRGN